MKRKKFIPILVIMAMLVLLLDWAPAVTAKPPAVNEPLKLGLLLETGGPLRIYGETCINGATLAVEEVNRDGGVLGRQIIIIHRDPTLKPDAAIGAYRALVLSDKVDWILGPIISGLVGVISPVAKQLKFPCWAVLAVDQKLTEESFHRYFFRSTTNSYMLGKAAAIGMKKRGWKKVYIIAPDYSYGRDTVKSFKEHLTTCPEVKIIGEDYPPFGEKDFAPFITKIKAAKPDVFFCVIYAADLATFLKQAKPFGLLETTEIFGNSIQSQERMAMGKALPEGIWGLTYFECNIPPEISVNMEFCERYRTRFAGWPTMPSASGYVGVKFWVEAMKKAGTTTDRERIIDALEGLTIPSPWGRTTMRAIDHQSSIGAIVGVTKWLDWNTDYPGIVGTHYPAEQLWRSEEETLKKQGR